MKPTTITFSDETEYAIPDDHSWAILDDGSITVAGNTEADSKRFPAGDWVYLTEQVPGKKRSKKPAA